MAAPKFRIIYLHLLLRHLKDLGVMHEVVKALEQQFCVVQGFLHSKPILKIVLQRVTRFRTIWWSENNQEGTQG